MNGNILLDTGPLVAILSPRDSFHDVCVAHFKELKAPLLTSWPVLTEAAWLLRKQPDAFIEILLSAEKGLIRLLDLGARFTPWCVQFLGKYSNLGVQLADASLIYLAEREQIATIFTLDRRDFSIYRTLRNRAVEIIP